MISVVIITKNEERVISETVACCFPFTDDVIVLDSGSTDQTKILAQKAGAHVYDQEWLGYGPQKNKANSYAKYDWILSLDADERPDDEMIHFLTHFNPQEHTVYCFKLIDHFGNRPIQFSELRPKWKKRLFNKQLVYWDSRAVHEQLVLPDSTKLNKQKGKILHYSYETFDDFKNKINIYAELGGNSLASNNKKVSRLKKILNPAFRFFRSYVLYLGFLEGNLGFKISRALAVGLRIKYKTYDKIIASK